jgi:hypothetical protein
MTEIGPVADMMSKIWTPAARRYVFTVLGMPGTAAF